MGSDPREAVASALKGFLTEEQARLLIDEVLAIKKRASAEFTCRGCGKRQMQWTEVTDAKAVASALTDLANQAFGRPQESSAHNDPVQFYRLTSLEEADAIRDKQESRRGQRGERRENGAVRAEADGAGEVEAVGGSDL